MTIGQAEEGSGAGGPRLEARGTPEGGIGTVTGPSTDDGGRPRDEAFTTLLRSGDATAFGLLFDAWADPVYDRISNRGFTTADSAAIESDAFLATHRRLAQQAVDDPFRVVVMRAANQAMTAADASRVDLRMPVGPYAEDRLVRSAEIGTLATDPAVAGLLWECAEVLGPQVRDVLDLHARHRLTAPEVAAVMHETPASVDAILSRVEAGYGAVVRAKIMWRQGSPSHEELARVVAGHTEFDTAVVKLVAEHLRTCETCRAASQVPVPPMAVFAAIPVAIAPPGFKETVVESLESAGLVMDGSASSHARQRRAARGGAAAAGAVGLAGVAAGALAPPPGPDTPTTVVPPLGEDGSTGTAATAGTAAAATAAAAAGSDRKRGRGRSGRAEKPVETGRAVGLAAFAGPPESAAEADPAYATRPGGGDGSGPPDDADPGGGSHRGWLVAAAAAVVVVALVAALVLSGSGAKRPTKLATAPDHSTSTTAVSTTVAGSPTTAPTTTVSGTPPPRRPRAPPPPPRPRARPPPRPRARPRRPSRPPRPRWPSSPT